MIELGPSNMVFSGEGLIDAKYSQLLGIVESYSVETGELTLDLKDDDYKMIFAVE